MPDLIRIFFPRINAKDRENKTKDFLNFFVSRNFAFIRGLILITNNVY